MTLTKSIFTISALLLAAVSVHAASPVSPEVKKAWKLESEIRSRIKAPKFPRRDFVITNFGAVGDGQTDCTAAIAKAIDACAQKGGGHVVVPAGQFLTGAIHLKSNVDLHLDKTNSVLLFSTDP